MQYRVSYTYSDGTGGDVCNRFLTFQDAQGCVERLSAMTWNGKGNPVDYLIAEEPVDMDYNRNYLTDVAVGKAQR